MTLSDQFETIARLECKEVLAAAHAGFKPSEAIEAMIIIAFTRGARWALQDTDQPLPEPLDPRRGEERIADNE